ncbi:MAG TPA: NAD(P)/FAD-dependent oxidoreductase [Flavisolibacter sp.]
MIIQDTYDVAIIGGGLAGLALSIQLARKGFSVILFEKEKYPYHKVCGEYLSLESRGFLQRLGFPANELHLPVIDTLFLTAPNGRSFRTQLPLGGLGISRYLLDHSLAELARNEGVTLCEETRVEQVSTIEDHLVQFQGRQSGTVKARFCCGAYGKRSNLDVKWNRGFLQQHDRRLDNYVGVKYHVSTNWPEQVIGLHNFENGYCGISRIEDENYCLCYMTRADNLRHYGGNLKEMEASLLSQNPHLKKIFSSARVLEHFPVTISQISFHNKTQSENGVLLLGDAAGMITPLCGNGMSMALHSSKIAAPLIEEFLLGKTTREEVHRLYTIEWKRQFARRMTTGRTLQKFFGSKRLSNIFVSAINTFPFLAKPLIKMTHGKEF